MPETIIDEAKEKKYQLISEETLNFLLSDSEILIEKDTLISDKIRLLKFEDNFLIQEKSKCRDVMFDVDVTACV